MKSCCTIKNSTVVKRWKSSLRMRKCNTCNSDIHTKEILCDFDLLEELKIKKRIIRVQEKNINLLKDKFRKKIKISSGYLRKISLLRHQLLEAGILEKI